MIPVTESVPLQRAALERVKKRVVIHVHTVAHSHTVKGPQANRICRVADALSCREALAPRQELDLSPLASGERD
jgi:tRNA G37 N-methylase Trm5